MTGPSRPSAPEEEVHVPDHLGRLHRITAAARDLLAHAGVPRWEVYAKASHTRELVWRPGERLAVAHADETGVAVRSSHGRESGFAAASGAEPGAARRAVEGALSAQLEQPFDPIPPARLLGTSPMEEAAPLPASGWSAHVAADLAAAVAAQGAGLRVVRLAVEEGSYAWVLTTAEGFVASHGGTAVAILAEVALAAPGGGCWRDWIHVPAPAAFDARAAAARIADRAALTSHPGGAAASGVRDAILHPEVAAALIAALAPLFLTSPADPLVRLLDRDGRLAGEALTLVDDRSDPEGPAPGGCDGEGLPARRTLLLERGVPRHRLGCYQDAVACGDLPRGGAIRPSYRDCPASGVSNLRVAVDDGLPPAALLGRAGRALYLTRPVAPVVADPVADQVRILASGVWIDGGRVVGGHPVVELRGGLGRMLRRIEAVGTDLRWLQTPAGFVAAPSILVRAQTVMT